LFAASLLSAWLLIEGIMIALQHASAPFWSPLFNLGVFFIPILVLSVVVGLTTAAWGELLDIDDVLQESSTRVRSWVFEGTRERRLDRSASVLIAPFLFATWFASGVAVGWPILSTVRTESFALLLLCGLQMLVALGLFVTAPMLFVPARALLARFGRTLPDSWVAPAAPLVLLAGLGGVALIALWVIVPEVMNNLPWHFVIGPLGGAIVAIPVMRAIDFGARATPPKLIGLGAALVAVGLLTMYIPSPLMDGRNVFTNRSTTAGMWYELIRGPLDFDNDGYTQFFGENDCAPTNPDIGPHKREIVENGIDENCSGSDLTRASADFATGETSHPAPEEMIDKPNVVLVTTDSVSYNQTTVGGYELDTTPELADFAGKATNFEHAFATSSSTRLAWPSIVAGIYNSEVEMKNGRVHPYEWADSVTTIAEVMKSRGYHTVYIPGERMFFDEVWGGYTDGFDEIIESGWREANDKSHTAPGVTREALAQIRKHADSDKPLFLWMHYFDPHGPYKAPQDNPPFSGKRPVDHYNNELHWTDQHWGQVFDEVEKTWAPEEAMVIFTADHGEVFDRKHPPGRQHDFTLDTKVLHIPLLIQGPERRGETVSGLVTQADILPTIASVVGAAPQPNWHGESLVPVLFDGAPVQKETIYSLFYIPEAVKRGEDPFYQAGMRTMDYSYWVDLRTNTHHFIDWRNDRIEDFDLRDKHPQAFELYRFLTTEKVEQLREREKALSHTTKTR
jgi:arylsulfatase A-like enzyme